MMSNVIAFVAGANDDDSLSSGEVVECDSDCSQCCSENRSISMAGSSSSKKSMSSKMKELVEEVNSQHGGSQRSSKRRKVNSDGQKEEERIEDKENSMIVINTSR